MKEIVIAPEGKDAIEVGPFTDEAGDKFIAVMFTRPGQDRVVVTFTPELFRDFAGHLENVSSLMSGANFWN